MLIVHVHVQVKPECVEAFKAASLDTALPVPSGSELPWAWPEAWVNDEDFEVASQIAADFQRGNETNRP
jgi:hypothetical protein